eukprot:2162323-Lingulodinium_polyedra.AAC.1
MVPVAPDAPVWACFGAVPMGWTWGLYLAHDALQRCAVAAQASCGLAPDLIVDGRPPFPAGPSSAA